MAVEKIIEKSQPLKIETPPLAAEKVISPEIKTERVLPLVEKLKETVKPREKAGAGNIIATAQIQDFQKQRAAAIDDILAEGLNEIFLKMKPEERKEFQRRGEETVVKINELLSRTKVKVNKILNLIRRWLKLIPGINKFFLEQEAKIKTDKIIRIKDKF
ncbi:MAG: hypothetical protein WC458_04040 [Patescibacteria group bacterium]